MTNIQRIGALVAVLAAIGCAEATPPSSVDGAPEDEDFSPSADLSSADASSTDGGSNDLGSAGDLAVVTLKCAGETYDVNADPSDACEVSDAPLGNHSLATSVFLGSFSCSDGSSAQNVSGIVPADARMHSPAVAGFDSASGSAPDWFRIDAKGGLCANDLNLHLRVTGSAKPSCYLLKAQTSAGPYMCQADATGSCDISNGSGSYSDGTNIFITVSKTCAGNDKGSYTITGHL